MLVIPFVKNLIDTIKWISLWGLWILNLLQDSRDSSFKVSKIPQGGLKELQGTKMSSIEIKTNTGLPKYLLLILKQSIESQKGENFFPQHSTNKRHPSSVADESGGIAENIHNFCPIFMKVFKVNSSLLGNIAWI